MSNAAILRLTLGLGLLSADVGLVYAQDASGPVATPVVVELYTSQNCETCATANDLLGDVLTRPDVIALSFHVGYWDYAGWTDVLAIPAATARQQAYERALKIRFLYTPQFIVDGAVSLQAATRAELNSAIDVMVTRGAKVPLDIAHQQGGTLRISLPEMATDVTAKIWLAFFERHAETFITAGENAGRTMHSVNVVRDVVPIGDWYGDAIEIPLDIRRDGLTRYDGCAVLVQAEPTGLILGAAVLQPEKMESQ